MIFRMNADEGVEGGITPEEGREFAGLLEKAGVDALHVSGGVYGRRCQLSPPCMSRNRRWHITPAGIRARVTIPVIAVGKIHDPEIGEQLIAGGKADFVSLGRGLITDSHFARKVELGQVKNIRKCIECNQLCVDPLLVYG